MFISEVPMDALAIGILTFAITLAGASFGWWVGQRLPAKHLGPDSRDVIKVAMAMVATIAGLVLGLLVASAKSSFDTKDAAVRQAAVQVIVLDRTLAEYGPETNEIRSFLRELLTARMQQIWPTEAKAKIDIASVGRGPGVEVIQRRILALVPHDDAQRWLQSTALQITRDAAEGRWLAFQRAGSSIQWPLLSVVIFWLVTLFASFGLFAPKNTSVFAALALAALSVAAAIYLMVELDQPYSGFIRLSGAPLQSALEQISRN
jgi:hypothetical protein